MPKVEMDEATGELRWVVDEVVRDGERVRVPLELMDSTDLDKAREAARKAYADKVAALDATMTRHLADASPALDNTYEPDRDYTADAERAFADRQAAFAATMLRGRR